VMLLRSQHVSRTPKTITYRVEYFDFSGQPKPGFGGEIVETWRANGSSAVDSNELTEVFDVDGGRHTLVDRRTGLVTSSTLPAASIQRRSAPIPRNCDDFFGRKAACESAGQMLGYEVQRIKTPAQGGTYHVFYVAPDLEFAVLRADSHYANGDVRFTSKTAVRVVRSADERLFQIDGKPAEAGEHYRVGVEARGKGPVTEEHLRMIRGNHARRESFAAHPSVGERLKTLFAKLFH